MLFAALDVVLSFVGLDLVCMCLYACCICFFVGNLSVRVVRLNCDLVLIFWILVFVLFDLLKFTCLKFLLYWLRTNVDCVYCGIVWYWLIELVVFCCFDGVGLVSFVCWGWLLFVSLIWSVGCGVIVWLGIVGCLFVLIIWLCVIMPRLHFKQGSFCDLYSYVNSVVVYCVF